VNKMVFSFLSLSSALLLFYPFFFSSCARENSILIHVSLSLQL